MSSLFYIITFYLVTQLDAFPYPHTPFKNYFPLAAVEVGADQCLSPASEILVCSNHWCRARGSEAALSLFVGLLPQNDMIALKQGGTPTPFFRYDLTIRILLHSGMYGCL